MRDHTIETFFMIGGTLIGGLLTTAIFGPGVLALFGAITGFVVTTYILARTS